MQQERKSGREGGREEGRGEGWGEGTTGARWTGDTGTQSPPHSCGTSLVIGEVAGL